MKAEDLGFNPEHTQHNPSLTEIEETMLTILQKDHVGADCKIGSAELAQRFNEELMGERVPYSDFEFMKERWKREVRHLVNHLIIVHEEPILTKAGIGGGYWIEEDQIEVEKFYASFRRRGMTGLTKGARGRKAVLAETVNQLALEFDDLQTERPTYLPPHLHTGSTPLVLVMSLIDKMTKEPEKFGKDIEILRRKFGKVFMDKQMFQEIRQTSARLQELVGRIG